MYIYMYVYSFVEMLVMFRITVLYIFYASVTYGDLTAGPENTAVKNGSRVDLNCISNNKIDTIRYGFVQWSVKFIWATSNTLLTYRTSNNINLTSATTDPDQYEVNNIGFVTGQFNLTIKSASMHTAGQYTCEDVTIQNSKRSASFVVLESDPVCNLTQFYTGMDNNQVTMSCSVTYYGFWAPCMQWSLNGGSIQSSVNVTTNDTVTSILIINTTSSMDGQQYICRTFFSQQSLSTVTASNLPAYTHTWTAKSLKAFVSTRNISIWPDQILYNPGDKISCNATGFPAPEYQWNNLNDGSFVNTSQLVINESMIGRNLTYRCTAWNVIQGKSYGSSINKTFSVPCPELCTITSNGNELICNISYGRNYSWYSESTESTWLHSGPVYTTNISSISCLAVVNDNCSPIHCTNVSSVPESTSAKTITPIEVERGDGPSVIVGAVVGGVVGSLVVIVIILIVICLLRRKKCLKNNEREKSNGKEEIIPYSRHTLLVEDRNDERERQGEETSENIPNMPNYTQVDQFQKKKKPSSEQPPDLITNTQDQYAEIGDNLGMKNQGYEDVGMEVIKPKPKQTVGEDGTVYQDLNLSKPAASKPGPPKPKPAAPAVIGDATGNYASIDHLQIRQ